MKISFSGRNISHSHFFFFIESLNCPKVKYKSYFDARLTSTATVTFCGCDKKKKRHNSKLSLVLFSHVLLLRTCAETRRSGACRCVTARAPVRTATTRQKSGYEVRNKSQEGVKSEFYISGVTHLDGEFMSVTQHNHGPRRYDGAKLCDVSGK